MHNARGRDECSPYGRFKTAKAISQNVDFHRRVILRTLMGGNLIVFTCVN